MEQHQGSKILMFSTIVIVVTVVFLIILFIVFQRRKNKLLIERAEQHKQFEREIAETQIEIREETLRNISWELHDNIGQLLTLAKIQLQYGATDNLKEIEATITKALTELRILSKLINPEFIKNIELIKSIQLEIERLNRLNYINANLKITGKKTIIEQKPGIIIFRMLQEFFSNTLKHSKASNLNVELNYTETQLEIKASDNGIGFEKNKTIVNGIGLGNIKKRAAIIGATVNLNSEPKKGTHLIINYYF